MQTLKGILLECLQVVYNCNPWFSEGILDEKVWEDRVQMNFEQLYKQEEKFLIQFWVICALIWAAIKNT